MKYSCAYGMHALFDIYRVLTSQQNNRYFRIVSNALKQTDTLYKFDMSRNLNTISLYQVKISNNNHAALSTFEYKFSREFGQKSLGTKGYTKETLDWFSLDEC